MLSCRQSALGKRQSTNSSALLRGSKGAQSLILSRNFREHQQCQTEEGTVLVARRASSAAHPPLATPLVEATVAKRGEAAAVAAVVAAAAVASFMSAVSASTLARRLWSRFSQSAPIVPKRSFALLFAADGAAPPYAPSQVWANSRCLCAFRQRKSRQKPWVWFCDVRRRR